MQQFLIYLKLKQIWVVVSWFMLDNFVLEFNFNSRSVGPIIVKRHSSILRSKVSVSSIINQPKTFNAPGHCLVKYSTTNFLHLLSECVIKKMFYYMFSFMYPVQFDVELFLIMNWALFTRLASKKSIADFFLMKTLVCHKARLILVILSLESEPFQISSKSLFGPQQEDLLETSLINDTKP